MRRSTGNTLPEIWFPFSELAWPHLGLAELYLSCERAETPREYAGPLEADDGAQSPEAERAHPSRSGKEAEMQHDPRPFRSTPRVKSGNSGPT